ncbi:hypothetical protein CJ030_MR2G013158 [Morella rubra]|uniref:Uncharacterized protein n=1 Tax=Morella rubra TaxID=262757 RepID=A0A6A1W845_9ROSI|nr:hypothetical protein CJ030_MR2G013158 [Morella rubra]
MEMEIGIWDRDRGKVNGSARTGLLGLAVGPLGDGEMNLLAGKCFGFVRLLEAVPHQIRAYVGVRYVRHPRCSPKRHSCSARRHVSSSTPSLSLALAFALQKTIRITQQE